MQNVWKRSSHWNAVWWKALWPCVEQLQNLTCALVYTGRLVTIQTSFHGGFTKYAKGFTSARPEYQLDDVQHLQTPLMRGLIDPQTGFRPYNKAEVC